MTINIFEATQETVTETITYMGRKTRYSKVMVEQSYTFTHVVADAEVMIMDKTRSVKARRNYHNNGWEILGIACRYNTGEKVWNGTATRWDKSGNITVSAGLDNHARRNTCNNVLGWMDEYEARHSQHLGA